MKPTARLQDFGQSLWLDNIARALLAAHRAAGIDLDALAARLQADGAASFVASWNALMAAIDAKRAALGPAA